MTDVDSKVDTCGCSTFCDDTGFVSDHNPKICELQIPTNEQAWPGPSMPGVPTSPYGAKLPHRMTFFPEASKHWQPKCSEYLAIAFALAMEMLAEMANLVDIGDQQG